MTNADTATSAMTATDTAAQNTAYRRGLKDRQRIVVKVGSSSLLHPTTGHVDFHRIDVLARELCDLKNRGKEVILVSSGAMAVGRDALRAESDILKREGHMTLKQAYAAVGQARLMMLYQKFFDDYNQTSAQVLMTMNNVTSGEGKENLQNTFTELLRLGVIPVVNENDSVATSEIAVGDNDTLSAIVASLVGADLLILLSDVDGLYSDDPHIHEDAKFIPLVEKLDDKIISLGKSTTGSRAGTGGMQTKLSAAQIAVKSGCDMLILSGEDMHIIHRIIDGADYGTLFQAQPDPTFDLQRHLLEQ